MQLREAHGLDTESYITKQSETHDKCIHRGDKMKLLVTGAGGQLGCDVLRRCVEIGIEAIGTTRDDLDITDELSVRQYVKGCRPDGVIHCAAYTAVDKAEEEREACFAVNVLGTRNVAAACAETGAKLLYLSTDYVFDGSGELPWKPEDRPRPVNCYGTSKYQGELEIQKALETCFIVRISWVFGRNGGNFVKTMLRLAAKAGQEGRSCRVNVVADQIGSPTYTRDLAVLLCEMIATDRYGIYHVSNEGECSWAGFAEEIFRQAGVTAEVNPISTAEYPTPARRPKNSRMDKTKLEEQGFERLPQWRDALGRFLAEYKEDIR